MMMKRTRPALWIPFIMVCWGVCTTLMGEHALQLLRSWNRLTRHAGLVKNYPGLMAARAALGIAEGGLFPGMKIHILENQCPDG
jgi:hypothetical protein